MSQNDLFDKSLSDVIKKCNSRLKEKIDWFCDPEGPSISRFLIFNFFFTLVGFIILLFDIYLIISLYFNFEYIDELINTFSKDYILYVISSLLFLGGTLFVIGRHPRHEELNTGVYNEEIENLINEVNYNFEKNKIDKSELVKREIIRLNKFKLKPSEVSYLKLIPLNNISIDGFSDGNIEQIIAEAESDLMEYGHMVGTSNDDYRKYKFQIEDNIYKKEIPQLKERMRTIREAILWEKFLAGKGEALLRSLSHWSLPAIIALFIAGITPITDMRLFTNSHSLTFIHWGILGVSGAILYIVNHMKQYDTIKVGEDEGNVVVRRTLLGMSIGGISAILLYGAIHGGLISGSIFPNVNGANMSQEMNFSIFKYNSISLFWAIFAGFSAKLFEGIVGKSNIDISE